MRKWRTSQVHVFSEIVRLCVHRGEQPFREDRISIDVIPQFVEVVS